MIFPHILKRMREKIGNRQYVLTRHAKVEMDDDRLSIYDIERAILTGEILDRQRDELTGEWKYRVLGTTITGPAVEVIAKFSPTGTLVVITVYAL